MPPIITSPIQKYPVNRPLESSERERQLDQKKTSPGAAEPRSSVIRMNPTFLELPDGYFAVRGVLTFAWLFIAGAGIFLPLFFLFRFVNDPDVSDYQKGEVTLILLLICGVMALILVIYHFSSRYSLRRELFRYTHYPIRFNRKTRKVYCFRSDGTAMTEDWDNLFFFKHSYSIYAGRAGTIHYEELRFHRLSEDRRIVLETFMLHQVANASDSFLLQKWEFVRQFMEKGPKKLIDRVWFIHDISGHREKFWDLWKYWMAEGKCPKVFLVFSLIIFPFFLLFGISRWIAMRSCIVPVWPAEIMDTCQFPPDTRTCATENTLSRAAKRQCPT
jgi:hypothetical protein